VSDEQTYDRAQSYLDHGALYGLHHPHEEVHECGVDESVGDIGVHDYGLKVEESVDLLIHGGVASQTAVDV
jgi:hypothetical protein